MIKKAKIEGTIFDVISEETFKKNPSLYVGYNNAVAIEKDGVVYPIRNTTIANTMVGYYPSSDSYVSPRSDLEQTMYSTASIINFSDVKSFKELIEAQDKLNQAERTILTTPDNITIPIAGQNDSPFLQAIKRAITDKQIDLDKYGPRFGSNYPNEKRLLKKPDMTLQKGILYATCLDFDIYVTIKDSAPDVPNPIGETITVKLTGEGTGFSEEQFVDEEQPEEAAAYSYNHSFPPTTEVKKPYARPIYPIVPCTIGAIEKINTIMPIIFN